MHSLLMVGLEINVMKLYPISRCLQHKYAKERGALKDWSKREIWEPFIWEAQQATDDGLDLVKQLQLAKEEALYLMKTCKAPNARVGAIARYIETIKTEIELKQSLGHCQGQE
jgi:hypothetical protein